MDIDLVHYPQLKPPGGMFVREPTEAPGTARKFVVLVNGNHWVVAIGAVLDGESSFHADIARAAAVEYPNHRLRGGGFVRFTDDALDGTKAWFSGRSTAFGPFDPVMRTSDFRLALTRLMRCAVAVG